MNDKSIGSLGMLLGALMLVLGLVNSVPLAKTAETYATEIASDSVKTYITLRALNAVLSFAQEVEVSGGVVMASGTIQPFKVLEPVDDAVERLSTAIFLTGSIASLVTVLLPILGHSSFILLGLAIFVLSGIRFMDASRHLHPVIVQSLGGFARVGFLIYAAILAFAFASWIGDRVSESSWKEYSNVLEEVTSQMQVPNPEEENQQSDLNFNDTEKPETESEDVEGSITNSLSETWSSVSSSISNAGETLNSGVDAVKGASGRVMSAANTAQKSARVILSRSDELVFAMISVLAAFLFKLVVLPLAIFFVVVRLESATRPTHMVSATG
jgi:hypothetical protein